MSAPDREALADAEETLRGMRSPAVEGKAIQAVLNALNYYRSMASEAGEVARLRVLVQSEEEFMAGQVV